VVRGEGLTVARGVSPDEAFEFLLDPAQYVKADTKMIWVTKLADLPGGMIAREDGGCTPCGLGQGADANEVAAGQLQ
jgi:hypothetical protein